MARVENIRNSKSAAEDKKRPGIFFTGIAADPNPNRNFASELKDEPKIFASGKKSCVTFFKFLIIEKSIFAKEYVYHVKGTLCLSNVFHRSHVTTKSTKTSLCLKGTYTTRISVSFM